MYLYFYTFIFIVLFQKPSVYIPNFSIILKIIIKYVQVPHNPSMTIPKPAFLYLGCPVPYCLVEPT